MSTSQCPSEEEMVAGSRLRWANLEKQSVRTTCNLCLNYCGMIVSNAVKGIQLRGDPDNPLSQGFLCPKGKAALDIAASPLRIRHPMRRIGERGSQEWERISWEEALNEIAARLEHLIAKYGAESIAVQSLKPKDDVMWRIFSHAIGTPTNFRHDVHICFAPQLIADTLTFGNLVTYPNLTAEEASLTKTYVMWGINMYETNPAKALIIEHARKAGTKTIVVDPRPTTTAKKADLWLRVRPGTDAALALGMLHVIIEESLYDRRFIEEWTLGFDELKRLAEAYPPEKVAEITWVKQESIKAAARLIATNRPSCICTFIGLAMGGNVISTIRALDAIIAVTGNIDIAGANFIKHPPKTEKGFKLSEDILKRQISAEKFPLLAGPGALSPCPNPLDVVDALLSDKPYPIKGMLTDCNPLTSLENSKRTLEALMRLDLLVVFELFMTPTAEFADYVLPLTTFLESDFITEYTALNFIVPRNQVLEPWGEARNEAEVLLDILKRMKLNKHLPFSGYREYLDYRLKPLQLTFSEFSQLAHLVHPNVERKYEKGLLRPDGKPGFNTPTGKVELYSGTLEKYGCDPLPVFREPISSPFATPDLFRDYPFILITGTRSLPFYHGLGLVIPRLRKLHPDPTIEMSPAAADCHGFKEGDEVVIEVPGNNGRIRRKAHIVHGMHDTVLCAEGHWYLPEEKDREKRLWGSNINVLTELRNDLDPVVGGSGARALLCRISRA